MIRPCQFCGKPAMPADTVCDKCLDRLKIPDFGFPGHPLYFSQPVLTAAEQSAIDRRVDQLRQFVA